MHYRISLNSNRGSRTRRDRNSIARDQTARDHDIGRAICLCKDPRTCIVADRHAIQDNLTRSGILDRDPVLRKTVDHCILDDHAGRRRDPDAA